MFESVEAYMEMLLGNLASAAIILLECIGVFIVIWTGIRAFIMYIKKDESSGLYLAKGLSTALSFKMGGEILRTVVIRDRNELIFVAGIMLIRAAMSLLLHWEIKQEVKVHDKELTQTQQTGAAGE